MEETFFFSVKLPSPPSLFWRITWFKEPKVIQLPTTFNFLNLLHSDLSWQADRDCKERQLCIGDCHFLSFYSRNWNCQDVKTKFNSLTRWQVKETAMKQKVSSILFEAQGFFNLIKLFLILEKHIEFLLTCWSIIVPGYALFRTQLI